MIADTTRTRAYARAIEATVRPGDAVLEIGTGTGLFAMLACKAGARRVYAVEADDIIEIGRENAAANGFSERIEFIHAMSTEVSLPERVDVIVSDLRGVLPFFEHHLGSVMDARARFLAPGGRLVPACDRIYVACVEVPGLYEKITTPWSGRPYGVEVAAARELVLNTWRKEDLDAGHMITAPVCCASLDYLTVDAKGMAARARVAATRDGVAHGIAVWFETELARGIGFSCAPGHPERAAIYSQAYFPWPRAVELASGEEIDLALDARPVGSGSEYVWNWRATTRDAQFSQSSFHAEPLSVAKLRRRSAEHVAKLGDDARIDRSILELMDRGLALGEIAREVQAAHPNRFARWEDALARVGDLSERYAR